MRSGGCFTKKTSLFLQLARGDGERETPKDLFPRSLPIKGSEWPEDKGGCVFDFNNAQCPYGDKCSRSHAKNPTKSSPSSAATATNGSNSPKMRATESQMRKLSAQKERLQLEEEESYLFSSSSKDDDTHKAAPLSPYRSTAPSSSRSSGSKKLNAALVGSAQLGSTQLNSS